MGYKFMPRFSCKLRSAKPKLIQTVPEPEEPGVTQRPLFSGLEQ